MGYKYSVCLVFKHDDICCTLKHLPFVTLMRNMSYDNAFQYYRELLNFLVLKFLYQEYKI